jgi:hypothetical protein
MPTVAQLVKESSKLKVKEVPSHVQKFATQHWTPGQLQGRFMNWLQNYKVQVRAGRAGPPGGARSSRVWRRAGPRAAVALAGCLRRAQQSPAQMVPHSSSIAAGSSCRPCCLPASTRRG